jgi:light-regulated signal transduction histidine kinase (bacteriophytochrome)
MPASPRTDPELSEFLLRACHDLRGPLRTMRIHSELLVPHAGAALNAEQSLGFVVKGATAAAALVDGLTDYALALAIDPARFQPVPLDVLLRSAMAKCAAQIREHNAEIAYGDLPTLQGDADRLLQLFEYLLDYAMRRTAANRPSVGISAESQDGEWLFSMRDNGAALTTDALERVFKPFARVHGNDRPGPGLATCRAIVERHGGRMWAEAVADGGLVRFTLAGG